MDYQGLLYGPVYGVLGVPAVLHMGGLLGDKTVTAIDKTAGHVINQAVDVPTVIPVATVQASELIAKGIVVDDVYGKILTLNGKDWLVTSAEPKPSPNGEDDGEIYFSLDGGVG